MSNCTNLSYIDLQNSIEGFNRAYSVYKTNPIPANKQKLLDSHTILTNVISCFTDMVTDDSVYQERDFVKLATEYNSVIKKRSDLDLKLQEIYNVQNSTPVESKMMLDSTIYATLLWSILASI